MAVRKASSQSQKESTPQTDEEKLRIVFKKICGFCTLYNATTKSINAGSSECRYAADLIRRFSVYLSRLFPDLEKTGLSISVAKAKPSMPRVPWVAVLPKGKFVGTSLSVAICFGRSGNGAVVGLMQPSSSGLMGNAIPVVRSGNKKNVVDVDGNNPGTKYNDRFINPVEFLVSNVAAEPLVKHLDESLTLLRQLIDLNGNVRTDL
jgi:hypothetical protein